MTDKPAAEGISAERLWTEGPWKTMSQGRTFVAINFAEAYASQRTAALEVRANILETALKNADEIALKLEAENRALKSKIGFLTF